MFFSMRGWKVKTRMVVCIILVTKITREAA
jgi:hypothetical protein